MNSTIRERPKLLRQLPKADSAKAADCSGRIPALLERLTCPAVVIGRDLRIVVANQAYRDRFNGGRRVCGRHCYEVSHHLRVPCEQVGESCPGLRALRNDTGQEALHVHYTSDGSEEYVQVSVHPLNGEQATASAFLEILSPSAVANLRSGTGAGLVGQSPTFQQMLELIARVAPTMTTVLLAGESGTGKELVARALHQMSPRSDRPFVPVDCSGLTETLFESELFGHEKGAFTGAHTRKHGLVEAADGGTLFLDEVGDIPLPLQVKLLRLIETKAFRRVGNVKQLHSDFRLVCASHRDLLEMVRTGEFRADLYYRISSFPVELPPLRHRVDDLPLLADAIFGRLGCRGRCQLRPDALAALSDYQFPGNVRELANILERACLLSDDGSILVDHLPQACAGNESKSSRSGGSFPIVSASVVALEDLENRYIQWACRRFHGSRSELAEQLGISERTLYRKLRDH